MGELVARVAEQSPSEGPQRGAATEVQDGRVINLTEQVIGRTSWVRLTIISATGRALESAVLGAGSASVLGGKLKNAAADLARRHARQASATRGGRTS
jgi:hypothetical protein